MPREWNTDVRSPWNGPIRQSLNAIDSHSQLYLKTRDTWHLEQAAFLRGYVSELKTWILKEERGLKNK